MWREYISAASIEEVLQVIAEKGSQARIVAGGTDLILEMERGLRKDIATLIDVTRIPELDRIVLDEKGIIHLGPLVTHNQCVASKLIRDHAFPLAQACWQVGSPQIRNRGSIAGNIITGSPANDAITPLMALGATVTLRSIKGGVISDRKLSLIGFYTGVRRTLLNTDEMLVDITFPALKMVQRGTFIKFALRQAQAISLVNSAIVLTMEEINGEQGVVRDARITLGAVAPTIVHALDAEAFLKDKSLDDDVIHEAARLALHSARPISDIRGTSKYRERVIQVIVQRGLKNIADHHERAGFPAEPVLLMGRSDRQEVESFQSQRLKDNTPIITKINGKEYKLLNWQNKTLLRLLRENAGLIGSKEGCAEGECGACTVFLDGMAVMSCMVPAPRAHGAEIITVEGLANHGKLHPVQAAFIEEGAVQCGYCSPGFLMSAAKLLEERPRPNRDEIRQAITGNLCRCTGYYKIIQAIELAAEKVVEV
jgi:xanthine dehydrogenase iron-sulfur cluster and FAD-binding subunit A